MDDGVGLCIVNISHDALMPSAAQVERDTLLCFAAGDRVNVLLGEI